MNRKLSFLHCVFALLLLTAGCGGDGSKKAKIDSFTANPAIVPTEGGETTLVWDVRNADAIEIRPGIGAVTGTSLTLTVTETTEFELVAKRDGAKSTKRATVTVQAPNMVVGTVRGMLSGTVVPDVAVSIDGHPVVVTDDNGQFAVPDVSTPYQLTLYLPADNVFVVYQGLTRFDPVLDLPGADSISPVSRNVTLSGVVTGAVSGPGYITNVFVDNPLYLETFGTTANPGDGAYSTSSSWYDGPATTTARIHALRYTTGSPITSYLYGTATADIEDGVDETAVNLTMTSAGLASTTFRYPNFDSFVPNDIGAAILFGTPTGTAADEGFLLPGNAFTLTTANDLIVATPDLEGTSLSAGLFYSDVFDLGAAWEIRTAPVGTESVDVTLRPTPWTLLPVDGGIITPETAFVMGGPQDGASIFFFGLSGPSSNPLIMVVTSESTAHLPDLKGLGIDYTAYSDVGWFGMSLAPRATIDDVAGPGGILGSSPEYIGFTNSSFATFDTP